MHFATTATSLHGRKHAAHVNMAPPVMGSVVAVSYREKDLLQELGGHKFTGNHSRSTDYIHGMELPCAFTTIISFNKNIEFKGIALLSSSSKKATVTTQSDTDFTLTYDQGMFSGTFDRMTLNRDHLFKLNTTIERHNYSVTIVDTIDGEPSHIKIHVPKGIHHPDFIWQYQ